MRFFAHLSVPIGLVALLTLGCSAEPDPIGGPDHGLDQATPTDLQDLDGPEPDHGTDPAVDPEPGCTDRDGDGRGQGCSLGFDCNDHNPLMYEGAEEICDRLDNNCNGVVDEGCPCDSGSIQACYQGPAGTEGLGACRAGWQVCIGTEWGLCESQVLPQAERCDRVDNNCDGLTDEGLTNACGLCGTTPIERCGDVLDNDCDGTIDEAEAGCDCEGRTNQPCYSGPPHTLGVGVCRGGRADCLEGTYGVCRGEIRPTPEICDGLDNDCDGLTDEGLANRCGQCGVPNPREICDGLDNDCDGLTDEGLALPCGRCSAAGLIEICGNGLDDDCDGHVDDGCLCQGDPACYPGPPATRGIGACSDGQLACDSIGEFWERCSGAVLPQPEICDGLDNDCDGHTDISPLGCSMCQTEPEICDGVDNDCDGHTDEYLRNSCGACLTSVDPEESCGPDCCNGLDDDCDGLVDETLVNSCGKCGESCYTRTWSSALDNLDEGQINGVDEDLSDGLRIGTLPYQYPYLWVANSGEATVTKIDTGRFEVIATYPVGPDPSRTAVDLDGNLWVVNQAFTTSGGTLRRGSVTKIQAEDCTGFDCVLFTRTLGEPGAIPRGIAVDDTNHVWVGTYEGRTLYELDPDNGQILDTYPVGLRVYGLAVDSDRILWISNLEQPNLGEGVLGAFDIDARRLVPGSPWLISGCSNPYGIALDAEGSVWLGNWTCNNVVRFDPAAQEFTSYAPAEPVLSEVRGAAVDGGGNVWVVAGASNLLGRLDPSEEIWQTFATCNGPMGVGVAASGTIWVPCWNSQVWYYDLEGGYLGSLPVGINPFSYSDMTGFALTNLVLRTGSWTVLLDCGYPDCQFDLVRWQASTPSGTRVLVRARTSLDSESWSAQEGPFELSPVELGDLVPGRFLEVSVTLHTTERAASPLVSEIEVQWQRP
ncbi:MAG: hypothetical protein JW797_13560 [Bradymonadales bacterium]|nr:hypothetical protein [Bradymonadales bacterium]